MRGKFGVGVVYCLLVVLFPNALRAQLTTTTIYGRVTDANGGTIAGAQVAVTNTDTNLSRTAQTSAEGEYRIEFLPVGNYRVEIAAQAFKRFVRAGVVLEVNVPARVDSVMQLGDFNQIVTVAESVPLVDTTSPEIGRTIENQEVVNLPLVNRNVYQLLQLTPGVQNSSFNPGQPNPVITLGYPEQRTFINGGVDGGAGSVSYYLDGGINMTGLRNTGNILPNPDAIQEYRVETNNYNAEYGKMSSGVSNSAELLAVRSKRTRPSSSAPTRACGSSAAYCLPARPCQQRRRLGEIWPPFSQQVVPCRASTPAVRRPSSALRCWIPSPRSCSVQAFFPISPRRALALSRRSPLARTTRMNF